jgi:hypothetical protein
LTNFGAVGEFAINAIDPDDLEAVKLAWELNLDAAAKSVFFCAEIKSFDASDGETTRRFATADFITPPDDTPASTTYEGRVGAGEGQRALFEVERSIPITNGFFGGVARPRVSEIPIANADGALDSYFLRAVDGRDVTVRAGIATETGLTGRVYRLDQTATAYKGRAVGWTGDGRRMSLRLEDPIEQLERPVSLTRYAGTGGEEGPAAMADQTKPIALGECFNVPPVMLDEGLQIYQISVGPINRVSDVRDSGLTIGPIEQISGGYDALAAASLASGTVGVSLSAGLIRLASPPAGVVTVDCRGYVLSKVLAGTVLWDTTTLWNGSLYWNSTLDGPGYVNTVAGLARYIVNAVGWGQDIINSGSFGALDSLQDAVVGRYIQAGDETTALQILDEILSGSGCFLSVDRLGFVSVGQFTAPAASAAVSITDAEIVSVTRLDLPYDSPPYEWSIGYKANNRPMPDSDFAGAVGAETRQFYKLEQSKAVVTDNEIAIAHLRSSSQAVDSPFQAQTDAASEAARRLALYTTGRRMLDVRVASVGRYNRLGQTVNVTHSRHGLTSGANFVIVAAREDYSRQQTILRVWG